MSFVYEPVHVGNGCAHSPVERPKCYVILTPINIIKNWIFNIELFKVTCCLWWPSYSISRLTWECGSSTNFTWQNSDSWHWTIGWSQNRNITTLNACKSISWRTFAQNLTSCLEPFFTETYSHTRVKVNSNCHLAYMLIQTHQSMNSHWYMTIEFSIPTSYHWHWLSGRV